MLGTLIALQIPNCAKEYGSVGDRKQTLENDAEERELWTTSMCLKGKT